MPLLTSDQKYRPTKRINHRKEEKNSQTEYWMRAFCFRRLKSAYLCRAFGSARPGSVRCQLSTQALTSPIFLLTTEATKTNKSKHNKHKEKKNNKSN